MDGIAYLVFGATGGIGAALCRRLHRQGARVFLCGRDSEKCSALAAELDAPFDVADATDLAAVDAVFKKAISHFGQIHGAANCVGSILLRPAHLTSDEEWSATIATNLTSAFAVVKAAGRSLRGGGGSVVLVSSAAARIGITNHEAIAAAKGGVIGLTRSAAATYAAKGIRFNAVAPGLVETGLTERITSNEMSRTSSLAMHALGRFGTPEDIASAIAWLLDPEQSWLTGQVIGVDGGLADVRARGG